MSNLIRYIIPEDPEKQMKKNDLDYTKYSTSWAPIQKQSQEDKYKGYKFSSKNLLENSFNSLTANKSSQSKDDGSFMSGISNIFNNIKSDEKSSSNTPLPQSIAKTAAEESSKIGTVLSPKTIGNDNASYKIAQNNKPNIVNDATKQVSFNDVYWGDGSRKNTHQIEGGYNNNRTNDRGGPTNFAVTQNTLDEYNNWNSSLRTGFNFPKDVKDLKPEQARQILDERFYQAYNIKAIQNAMIARNVFDAEINQGTRAGKWLAESINENFETNYPQNMVISTQLAERINKLSEAEAIKINDAYTKKRMKEYLNLIDKDHSQINNIKSWYNRSKNHYSNPEEFDKLYQSTLDEYLNRKYPQYYNGK